MVDVLRTVFDVKNSTGTEVTVGRRSCEKPEVYVGKTGVNMSKLEWCWENGHISKV